MRSHRRDWQRTRSGHARVLESLAEAVAAHPSASGRRLQAVPGPEARVAEFRPRVVSLVPSLVPGAPDPDDPPAA